jgi:hypothetical protein
MMNAEHKIRSSKRKSQDFDPESIEMTAQLDAVTKRLAVSEKAYKTEENKRKSRLAEVQARSKQDHNLFDPIQE